MKITIKNKELKDLNRYYTLKDDDELVMTGKQLREWRQMIIDEAKRK